MHLFNITVSGESPVITWPDVVIFVLCLLMSFLICVVNILTMLVISRTPSLRSYAMAYVGSLAVVDFLVGLQLIPLALFVLPPTRVNLFDRYISLCLLMNGLNMGVSSVSIIHMAVIAVDRYLYIAKPYFYEKIMNTRVVISCVCFAWLLGLMFMAMPQFVHTSNGNITICDLTRLIPVWHVMYGVWVLYFTLSAIILLMYCLILRTAFKKRAAINSVGPVDKSPRETHFHMLSRASVKGLKFFLTLFGVFFACMTPVVVVMGLDYYVSVPSVLYRFLVLLAFSNSGMNFVIFALQNMAFRHSLCKMLPCCCCK
ncbi:unnamed protein product, partial [Lymnaea stagnalis]